MKTHHRYSVDIKWTGNRGKGTYDYTSYDRSHTIQGIEKEIIHASSDPAFAGSRHRYNPEELFISSLSSCHMLWYLHLCAINNIIVTDYKDNATGVLTEVENGSGKFTEVILNPVVKVKDKSMREKALELHNEANKMCFIANSCNFTISHQAKVVSEE